MVGLVETMQMTADSSRPEPSREAGFVLVERTPTVAEYQRLNVAVGWGQVVEENAAVGLPRSLYSVCAVKGGEVVGCGRVVGDGGLYFYVQDLVVLPEHRRKGIGHAMMDAIMAYVGGTAKPGAFIGLMAARGYAGFYTRYGFAERPANAPGMFMRWGQRP